MKINRRRRLSDFAALEDVRYALRWLRRRPLMAATCVVLLALGVGTSLAVTFTASNVLIAPLPFKDEDRLVMAWFTSKRRAIGAGGREESLTSYPNFQDLRQVRSLETLAAFATAEGTLLAEENAERARAAQVTEAFFSTLGLVPLQGRFFAREDFDVGRVAVVSHGLWQRRFGSAPDAVGRSLVLDGNSYTIVGVAPKGHVFPEGAELWLPLVVDDHLKTSRGALWLALVGRLKSDVQLRSAQGEIDLVAQNLARAYPRENAGYGIRLAPLRSQLFAQFYPVLRIIGSAAVLVLLLTSVNVAALLLAESLRRTREMSTRVALGSSRWRLIGQCLMETGVLALLGGLAGVPVAIAVVGLLRGYGPPQLATLATIPWDMHMIAAAFLITMTTAFACGLVPALHVSGRNPADLLKDGPTATAGPTLRRLRDGLVVAEIALALSVVFAAGLHVSGLRRLHGVDLGFNPDGLLTAKVELSGPKYADESATTQYFEEMLARLGSLHGIRGAAAVTSVFLDDPWASAYTFRVEGRAQEPPENRAPVPLDVVTAGYFDTVGLQLLNGRVFSERDTDQATPVAIVSESVAKRFWISESPVGRRIRFGGERAPWITIVGVVQDSRRLGPAGEPQPTLYLPSKQSPRWAMTFVLRTPGSPRDLIPAVRAQAAAVDRGQPVFEVATMRELLERRLWRERFAAAMFGAFSLAGLFIASIGVHGAMVQWNDERQKEMAIRAALGAARWDILLLVAGRATGIIVSGLLLGAVSCAIIYLAMATTIFGLRPAAGMATWVLAAGAVAAAGAAACLPALTSPIEPARTLRQQ